MTQENTVDTLQTNVSTKLYKPVSVVNIIISFISRTLVFIHVLLYASSLLQAKTEQCLDPRGYRHHNVFHDF